MMELQPIQEQDVYTVTYSTQNLLSSGGKATSYILGLCVHYLGADHLISGGGVEENMEINKIFPILLKINKIFPSLLEINKLFLILPEKNELFHPKNNLFLGLIP